MRAIVRGVPSSYGTALAKYFGTGPTDIEEARNQHSSYVSKLKEFGVSIKEIETDNDYPDCCFVEDHAVVAGDSALITNVGHDSRLGEKEAVRNALKADMTIVSMDSDARMDGGDVLQFGDQFLVGLSNRTNEAGIRCLKDFVEDRGFSIHVVQVPSNSLHLISICTSPIPGVLLAPEGWFTSSDFPTDAEILWIPGEEAYAANVIPFEKDIMVATGYPRTCQLLEERGLILHSMEMSQFKAADGSLTCLSVLYL
ncbi:MAG: arginine deiminase-related protein [Candidatus Thermoplasmatota archaeon]|nr:arginine deiminase-related protein [Candidatus Thermoplasmatota archaeon]